MHKSIGLIVVLLGAVLSGASFWLLSAPVPQSSQSAPGKTSDDAKALTAQLSEELTRDTLSHKQRYILERAAADWPRDPFERPGPTASRETAPSTTPAPATSYAYSGYVEVDKKKLAIINGMQYQVGDPLESGRFAIRSIDSEKVVLEHVGKPGVVILPFLGGGR